MFKMVMYRISPDVSKGLFWTYTGDFINSLSSVKTYLSDNQVFYRSLPDEIKYTDEPCYKLFYLKGIHAPRTTDQNIERVEDGKVIPTDCAIGVNKVLSEYFELLKKGGVYDNSDIIVLADHGQRPNYGGKFPLFMIKLAGDTQEGIRTSSVPVSYADFYSTCLFLLGDESSKSTSVFALSEGEKRERYFAESDEYITEDVDRTLPLIENGD
jgi:hypothetical protein